jgi:CDP-diacylglycerol--glycerol-3-phosphate 3-phosphatidyltransferase
MNLESADRQLVLQKLYAEWALFAAFSLSFLASGYVLISAAWQSDLALRWLFLPSLVTLYLLRVLWQNLDTNVREGEQVLLPDLGWGNRLTLLRGVLVAGMTGFLVLPRPEGWLIWVPGILYTLSDATDFFDGYVARRTDHATRLGKILDMSFDGLGVLVASLLVVLYGQAPAWYLLVGFARYLFLAGEWLRRRLGKPVYPIPPSLNRRVFAGLQMGFLAVALWPIFTPPGIHIAAALFGLPLLVGFGRDWLYASGVIKDRPARSPGIQTRIERWLPVGLRLLILALNLGFIASWLSGLQAVPVALVLLGLLNFLAVAMLVLGVLPRLASILALLALGFAQLFAPLSAGQIVLGISYTLILFIGSGALSLWTPEDYLYRHYAGERRALDAGQGI